MNDLPGVPSDDQYSELRDLVREYLEVKREELKEGNWKREAAEDVPLAVLTAGDMGDPMYKYYSGTDLNNVPVVTGEFPGKEGDVLFDYLEGKTDEKLTTSFLRRLYIDAFGRNAEDIDSWEKKIPEIERKIIADLNGLSKQRTVLTLRGVTCERGDITIGDDIRLIYPQQGESYATTSKEWDQSPLSTLHLGAILEYTSTKRANEDYVKLKSIDDWLKIKRTLQLYSSNDVEWVTKHREPITYRPNLEYEESPGHPLMENYSITPEEASKIDNLFELISYYFDEGEREFRPPIRVALDHFETAVSTQTNYSSSITFSIIGLESLYKHYTNGEGSSKFVRRYIAFVLSQVVPHLDVDSVKETIEEAYGTRSDTVHGDDIDHDPGDGSRDLVLDYLRYSIVIFALLKRDYKSQFKPSIDKSFINNEARKELTEVLEEIDLSKYFSF